jgi:hypothetical protein
MRIQVGAGERLTTAPTGTLDTAAYITSATIAQTDDLVRAMTCYAKDGLSMVERQLRRAYGDRVPGSHGRWVSQTAEREAMEQNWRDRNAWKLYRRVHGEPCAAELRRQAFEAEVKAKGLAEAEQWRQASREWREEQRQIHELRERRRRQMRVDLR